jgi:hypothetical protein
VARSSSQRSTVRAGTPQQLAQLDELIGRAVQLEAAWGCDFFTMRNGEFLTLECGG